MTELETYTFYMPGEEKIFFKHFHLISIAALLLFSLIGFKVAGMPLEDSCFRAIVFVLPLYFVYYGLGKRFAEEVRIDFATQKVRFRFNDERGVIEKDFQEIRQVNFQYYLCFVLDDAKYMIKRPPDKKEIFRVLAAAFKINRGYFAI